jgi:hypothetical protein
MTDTIISIGSVVRLKTDVDNKDRLVTGYTVRPTGVQYDLACGDSSTWHYEIEITTVEPKKSPFGYHPTR